MLPKISIYYHIFLQFKGKTCNDEYMEEIKNTATFCGIRHKGRIWKSVHTWSIHFITAATNRNYSLLKTKSESHYSPWSSPGQNTGVGSLSLLQGIFPTQGSNPGLPHCRRILYQLSHLGSPWKLKGNNRKSSHFDGNTQVLSQSWIQCNFRRKNIKNWWNQLLFQQKAAAKSTFNYNHPSLMFLKPLDTKLLQLFSP